MTHRLIIFISFYLTIGRLCSQTQIDSCFAILVLKADKTISKAHSSGRADDNGFLIFQGCDYTLKTNQRTKKRLGRIISISKETIEFKTVEKQKTYVLKQQDILNLSNSGNWSGWSSPTFKFLIIKIADCKDKPCDYGFPNNGRL